MFELQDFQDAVKRIRSFVTASPVKYSKWLSTELNAEVYLKLECILPGNSFKIRGASNTIRLYEEQGQKPSRVITASGGNHGLGVAIASRKYNIPCLVVLPLSTSEYRVKLLENEGAEVLLHGNAWDEANIYAKKLAESSDILYIHPFADPEVIQGQGTIALELDFEFDTLVASVGGGGLLAGISLAFKSQNKEIEIVAVETSGADSLAQSLEAGEIKPLDSITSIAKTLGAKQTIPFIFDTLSQSVDHMLVVDDKDAVKAMLDFLDNEKILVEPAMSCTIAAALANKKLFKGKKIVFIVCGSNVTLNELLKWKDQFLDF